MRITPHLSFNGQCEEAFLEYQRIIGGEKLNLLKYGDSPMAESVDPRWHGRIIHASLQVGDHELAGTDSLPDDYKQPQGFSVILSLPDVATAAQVFRELSAGGSVLMPFQQTFWSQGFGVFTDRFNIPWEINCENSPDHG